MKKFYRIFAISFWLLCLILVLVLIGLLFTKFFWIGAISLMSISIFLAINADRNAKHEDYYEEN
jgi:Kef-type K+ transport system membrane component KefB